MIEYHWSWFVGTSNMWINVLLTFAFFILYYDNLQSWWQGLNNPMAFYVRDFRILPWQFLFFFIKVWILDRVIWAMYCCIYSIRWCWYWRLHLCKLIGFSLFSNPWLHLTYLMLPYNSLNASIFYASLC